MVDDDETKTEEKNNMPVLNKNYLRFTWIFALIFFMLSGAVALYSFQFLVFWYDKAAFIFYCITTVHITIALLLLMLFPLRFSRWPQKRLALTLFLVSLAMVATVLIHIAVHFWLDDALFGCDGMFFILATPFAIIISFAGLVILLNSIYFLVFLIKNRSKT
ncbi:MAG: hypothetical protein FWE84_00425 [Firmicutes bacterium]|nr:hypothetical protein [Bacillota bacterium]